MRAWAITLVLFLLVAWFWTSTFLYPLRMLVVFFHELGHAVAALATGGQVESIGLSPNEGGVARTVGGSAFVVLNAGYLGSLVIGLLLLIAARRKRAARALTVLLGLLLMVSALVYVRPILSFGFGFALIVAAALLVLGLKAPPGVCFWVLRVLGIFSVFYALMDIRSDVFRLGASSASDAAQLAGLTHIPAALWGIAWIVIALGLLLLLRKRIV